MSDNDYPYSLLERVFREEAGRLTARLVRLLGDFDLAEDLVSEAVVEALEHWSAGTVPKRPAAWLFTTVRRKGLDRLRRDAIYREKLTLLATLSEPERDEPDDRLRLIFTCCHPALSPEAQVALTLRAVCGLTTGEIARAFLLPEATLGKRIVRAKRKIVEARIPYRVPEAGELPSRLHAVLAVIYLIFNEGYLTTSGVQPIRRDLVQDAEWLATLLIHLLPDEPEPLGLLALIRLHLARWQGRIDGRGALVLLEHQDRSLWDRGAISRAADLIVRAASYQSPGRYQIEAAIAALHCEAPSWEQTDWHQIVALYTVLAGIDGSPIVRLNRAVALSHVLGADVALEEVDRLADDLGKYHLFHAARAVMLRTLKREPEARAADGLALGLAQNSAERALLEDRIQ